MHSVKAWKYRYVTGASLCLEEGRSLVGSGPFLFPLRTDIRFSYGFFSFQLASCFFSKKMNVSSKNFSQFRGVTPIGIRNFICRFRLCYRKQKKFITHFLRSFSQSRNSFIQFSSFVKDFLVLLVWSNVRKSPEFGIWCTDSGRCNPPSGLNALKELPTH